MFCIFLIKNLKKFYAKIKNLIFPLDNSTKV